MNANLHIGPAPDYVLKMGKEFLKHKGIMEIIKPKQSAKREIHTDYSLQMLIRTLKQRQNTLAPDFVGPLHWEFGDAIETKISATSGCLDVRIHIPRNLSQSDKDDLHDVIIRLFSTT